jgi:hypothetical protein
MAQSPSDKKFAKEVLKNFTISPPKEIIESLKTIKNNLTGCRERLDRFIAGLDLFIAFFEERKP